MDRGEARAPGASAGKARLRALLLSLGVFGAAMLSGPLSGAEGPYRMSDAEAEAYKLYAENKLVGARTKAEALLDSDDASIVGHFVLGSVMREAEGLLPRAMHHLGRARELLETRYGPQPPRDLWTLHREILFAAAGVAGEMEEHAYQLELLDFHDALYDPDLLGQHAWAFLGLGRFDEARSFAKRASESGDPDQRSLGRNALCAIEGEAGERQAYFDACAAALAHARERARSLPKSDTGGPGSPVAVHAYNAALAALSRGRFDDAEKLAREGAQSFEFTVANPWRILVRLYTDAGRISEAASAAREMDRWRVRQPASYREQDRAETDLALATLLLVVGELEAADRLVDRALERPDRRGVVSSTAEQALGATALARRAVKKTRAELSREQASVMRATGKIRERLEAAALDVGTSADEARLVSLLSDDARLEATFRIHVRGGLEPVPAWLLGDLVPILGPGVVSVVLERVREKEKAPEARPYHDALEAEVRLAQRDPAASLDAARRALAGLPKAEALLEARVALVGAEAARALGDAPGAMGLYERSLGKDPGALRRMGLAVPARIQAAPGDPALARAAELLEGSPRLRSDPSGFPVTLEKAGAEYRACLRTLSASEIACATLAPEPKESADSLGRRLAAVFHDEVFAARVGLTAHDVQSLDGSTTLASKAQRWMLQEALRELAGE